MAAACAGSRQASVTAWPRSRSSVANAVPHDPPPTTTTFTTAPAPLRLADEVDRDRHALEAEALAQPVLHPVAAVARHQPRVVHVDAEARRPRRPPGPGPEVQPRALPAGRLRCRRHVPGEPFH